MGLFDSEKTGCLLCGKEIKASSFSLKSIKTKDGYICIDCFTKYKLLAPDLMVLSKQQLVALQKQKMRNDELNKVIQPTSFVICPLVTTSNDKVPYNQPFIEVDESNKLLNIPEYTGTFTKSKSNNIYHFNEIIDFELLEDGLSITSGNSLIGAAVGGALTGGFGAIIGSAIPSKKTKPKCTSMSIKITFNNMGTPTKYITFINKETKHSGSNYKELYNKAQECLSILTIIMKNNREEQTAKQAIPVLEHSSAADEILKYKQLLDMGAITLEEFSCKKKELLGL